MGSTKNSTEHRQQAIQALLRDSMVGDQQTLIEKLSLHYGIETNQTVVSRDLRKLGVIKREVKGRLIYELPTVDVRAEMLKLALIAIEHNEMMIVIKTQAGLADFVGECLDQHTDLEVLGCLSGENVVFVVPTSIARIQQTYEAICQRFQFKR